MTFECIEVQKCNIQMLHSTVNATQMLQAQAQAQAQAWISTSSSTSTSTSTSAGPRLMYIKHTFYIQRIVHLMYI